MKKNKSNRITIGLITIVMLMQSIPQPVLAQQTSTGSASTTTENNYPPLEEDSAFNTLNFDLAAPTSAGFKKDRYVLRLAKRNFQVKEKIQFVVRNVAAKDQLSLKIEKANSPEVNARVEEKSVNGEVIFNINPEVGMEPGQYTVKIIDDETGEVLSEQNFLWGVLAINTHKSIYLPGETAEIAIAVLDEGGRMVCDAPVTLEITDPLGNKKTLSTYEGTVKVNRECMLHDITEKPDYEAAYVTSEVGRYTMSLTATTLNGTFNVKDRFEVRNSVRFDITRNTATRIFPPETYPVGIKIKANEAFKGKIVESVPQEFQIRPGVNGTISYNEEIALPQSFNATAEYSIPMIALPFDGKYPVTLGFGEQIEGHGMEDRYKMYGIDGHDGIDFGLPKNTPVLATDRGEVILAQEDWIYGHSVVIEHAWGRSYYGHLNKIFVTKGQKVQKGEELGLSGSSGLAVTGPHLHFSIKSKISDINNLYYGKIDPAPFLGIANEDSTVSKADYPIEAKAIVWNVNIAKGEEVTIGYQYKAPNKSPYFYTIGPLQFITADIPFAQNAKFDVQQNPFVLGEATASAQIKTDTVLGEATQIPQKEEVIFSEIRQWQIAADVDTTIVLDALGDGTCGSGCWTVPDDWTDVNTIRAIGGGGAGDNLTTGGGGGGGGAYASITNLNLTAAGSITFGIGAGGTDSVNGGISWFNAANAAACTDSAICVKGAGGTTATSATGGAGGSIAGTNSVGTTRFAGGTGGNGSSTGDDSTGGGGGAGSPNGTGGTGGGGDSVNAGEEAMGGGGGSGCDSIGASNDGVQGGANGGNGGASCFASGGAGGDSGGGIANGLPGTNGSGGGGADTGDAGGDGGDGISTSDPSLAGGGGGGGDDDAGLNTIGGNGGLYGGGGGGGATIGTGAGGVVVITYTPVSTGPILEQLMRNGKWFDAGVEQPFTF